MQTNQHQVAIAELHANIEEIRDVLADLPVLIHDVPELDRIYRATFAIRGALGMGGYGHEPISSSDGLDACLRSLTAQIYPLYPTVGVALPPATIQAILTPEIHQEFVALAQGLEDWLAVLVALGDGGDLNNPEYTHILAANRQAVDRLRSQLGMA